MTSRLRLAACALPLVLAGSGCASRPDPGVAGCGARQGALVSFPSGVVNAAFIGDTLYFNDTSSRIARVSLAGGAIETLVGSDATGEWTAGGNVFAWETEPVHATPQSPSYVDQLHIRDQAGVVHDFPPTSNGSSLQLHADVAGNVYWLSPDGAGVKRWDHVSQAVTDLADAQLRVVDEVVDEERLYWVGADGKSIVSLATSGGAASTLATLDVPTGGSLSILGGDVDTIYVALTWPSAGPLLGGMQPAEVEGIAKSGGAPFVVADGVELYYANVASDDMYLYLVTVPGGGDYIGEFDLVRAPRRGGGAVEKLASSSADLIAIGADACNLYTVTNGDVSALAKR
jgi:hypothetical protein